MENEIASLVNLDNEILTIDFEKKLMESQQLCLIYISSARIKKDDKGFFSITIKWKDHFESKFIKYNKQDFVNDIWTFLSRKKVDLSFEKKEKYYSYKIIIFDNKKEAFDYYLKYLNFAFDLINESLIYKSNSEIFIEEFLFAFFIFRGSYDDNTFEYLTGISKNSYLDEGIPHKFFFEFYSKKIVQILNLYNFPKTLKFIYIEKSNEIHFRVKAKFLSENINSFKNNKLNLNFLNKKWQPEFPNTIDDYLKVALERRNKYNNVLAKISNSKIFSQKSETSGNENNRNKDYENKEFNGTIYLNEKDRKEIKSVWQRDTESIKKIKNYFFEYSGRDFCEICSFSFESILNRKYIEIHHIISRNKQSIEKEYRNLKEVKRDFVFLCSNCHKLADRIGNINKKSDFYIKYDNLLKQRI